MSAIAPFSLADVLLIEETELTFDIMMNQPEGKEVKLEKAGCPKYVRGYFDSDGPLTGSANNNSKSRRDMIIDNILVVYRC